MNPINDPNKPVDYYLVQSEQWTRIASEIIVETPMSLTVNGEVLLSFMCTPVDQEALAVGFLYNEGMINSMEEIVSVRVCPAGDNVDVWLTHSVEKPSSWLRTSGCTGGFTSLANEPSPDPDPFGPPINGDRITYAQIQNLIEGLFESQDLYKKSGGVHSSILSDGEKILAAAEDIGRHNTLDKISGKTILEGISSDNHILLSTGRISSEMLQKASRLGATIVVSRTSPSSLSIENAHRLGITLIGYARRNQFRVYTHPERILEYDLNQKNKDQSP